MNTGSRTRESDEHGLAHERSYDHVLRTKSFWTQHSGFAARCEAGLRPAGSGSAGASPGPGAEPKSVGWS